MDFRISAATCAGRIRTLELLQLEPRTSATRVSSDSHYSTRGKLCDHCLSLVSDILILPGANAV